MYDILIKNGTVVDGSGRPMYQSDVAIKEDRIVALGDFSHSSAERVIDAAGRYVTPGFVDVNNHSDTYWQLLSHPELQSLLFQGVTTIIGGNSGSSLAPLTNSQSIRSIQKWTDVERINFDWLSMQEFLSSVELRRPTVNFATLVGHGTLRRSAMKDETRTITPDEIEMMGKFLKQAIKEGAIGMSTGLKYTHARGAGSRELTALTALAAASGGVYATYMRDEEAGLVKSVQDTIVIASDAGAPVHISHLKAVGQANWPLMDEAFSLIENAALSGVSITFDVYPYTTTGSVMYTLLPEWITQEGRKMMLRRLKDPNVKSAVVRDMKKRGLDYSKISISASTLSRMLSRRHVSDIAKLQGKEPEQVVVDFLVASDGRAIVSLEMLSERNVQKAIQHPFSIISSNGSGYDEEQASSGDFIHPRNFGTFPKVFAEYVRGQKLLSWEEAVHKMSGKPALKFKLEKRGLLQAGYAADIVVFDPQVITDKATIEDPYQYATGVEWLLVNGSLVIETGAYTGRRAGMVLRHKNPWFRW